VKESVCVSDRDRCERNAARFIGNKHDTLSHADQSFLATGDALGVLALTEIVIHHRICHLYKCLSVCVCVCM